MSSTMANDNNSNSSLAFIKNIMNSHKSIRWAGIIDKNGTNIHEQYREGLKPLLTNQRRESRIYNQYNN